MERHFFEIRRKRCPTARRRTRRSPQWIKTRAFSYPQVVSGGELIVPKHKSAMPVHRWAIRRCPGIRDNSRAGALEVIMALTKCLTKNGDGRIRVLVADSTPLTGRLIADVLKRDRRFAISDASGNSVLPTAASLKPDVAILSETLEGVAGRGFEILIKLRAAVPKTRTVMLLDSGERTLVVQAFRSGARGVFCRNDAVKMLARCVHKVHEGQLWMNDPQLEFLLETLATAPATRLVDSQGATLLSNREQDVIRWLAEGHTNIEIARELKLSQNTVKNYMSRIFSKLGMSSRVEVVTYAASQRASAGLSVEH